MRFCFPSSPKSRMLWWSTNRSSSPDRSLCGAGLRSCLRFEQCRRRAGDLAAIRCAAICIQISDRSCFALAKEIPTNVPRFPSLTREPVLEQPLPEANPPVRLVRGARIRFAPGQPTGLHRHPMSTVGVVTKGSFRFQQEGEVLRLLETGATFFEPAGHTILKFDNASSTEEAEIVCFYLTDGEERPLIEMLAEET
jgi:quercetin dioxygenase-like cupin family protein